MLEGAKTVTIPDEAVEAAAIAHFETGNPYEWKDLGAEVKAECLGDMTAALEAAAPYIQAQVQAARAEALEDAADAADDPSREDMDTYFLDQSDVGRWLRARAVAERGEG
jgi:hypothetical protein